jgi:hypothetical protein
LTHTLSTGLLTASGSPRRSRIEPRCAGISTTAHLPRVALAAKKAWSTNCRFHGTHASITPRPTSETAAAAACGRGKLRWTPARCRRCRFMA